MKCVLRFDATIELVLLCLFLGDAFSATERDSTEAMVPGTERWQDNFRTL